MCGKVRRNISCSYYFFITTIFFLLLIKNCLSYDGRKTTCTPLKYEKFHIEFYFFSRNKRNQYYDPNTEFKPEKIDFHPQRRTTVLIHGFMGTSQSQHMQTLSGSLLKWQDSNVISVQWNKGCSNVFAYPQAVVNTEYAAIQIGHLFKKLIDIWKNTLESVHGHWGPIHLIGHSLGAHVAGQAAELLKRKENLTVDRITGLDPAAPCFENVRSPLRLKSSNAKFVDIVHTDIAKTGSEESFGLRDSIGHVDFYVNGGSKQPGCNKKRRKRNLDYISLVLHSLSNGLCDHNRALTLFTETIEKAISPGCQFWAQPWRLNSKFTDTKRISRKECKYCIEMGIRAENYSITSKTYYVSTTAGPPFCKKSI